MVDSVVSFLFCLSDIIFSLPPSPPPSPLSPSPLSPSLSDTWVWTWYQGKTLRQWMRSRSASQIFIKWYIKFCSPSQGGSWFQQYQNCVSFLYSSREFQSLEKLLLLFSPGTLVPVSVLILFHISSSLNSQSWSSW